MAALLSALEETRLQLSKCTEAGRKARLGQFLTPASTARFMAGLFTEGQGACRLLDAGAGIGSLSAAFLERWRQGGLHFQSVALDAFELDPLTAAHLQETLEGYRGQGGFAANVHEEDFIHAATQSLVGSFFGKPLGPYTHAILNPPYRKMGSASPHRRALRSVGIETVNLYSAFVALALALAAPGGQLVAIIPRSFCNGPYYRPFRDFILQRAAIRRLHLFSSRSKAFKDDQVLQESVIIHLERDGRQGRVGISTSTDDSFADLAVRDHPFERIVLPQDPGRFIHMPTSSRQDALERLPGIRWTLDALGVQVSTGPVVDFRLQEHLRDWPAAGTAPLLYPCHFTGQKTAWPLENSRKPNAIARNAATEKWLYPNGCYCVVRRFSAKEERRRLVASVVEPAAFGAAPFLGFENHLNVFHQKRQGLAANLAHGLAAYLNTRAVDDCFRRFNGHTQVNATDLRLMKYPSRDALARLGAWARQQPSPTQAQLDEKLEGTQATSGDTSMPHGWANWGWKWTPTARCPMWRCTMAPGTGCCWWRL